jgi:ubiquinone/menaquinone biosynthesis C-methylase UbiE
VRSAALNQESPTEAELPSLYDLLREAIPNDHSRQSNARHEVKAQVTQGFAPSELLDLGCGNGNSIDFFREVVPAARWIGVDISISPEVLRRQRSDGEFVTFDGVNLPFADGTFGLVYSYQVFEHVRHPEALLAEVRRVLREDGLMIGQTSQLEPYHSFSYWNYTVYGFRQILETAGLKLLVVRPGIDGLTLIERALLGRPKEWSKWFTSDSPLNQKLEADLQEERRSTRVRNYRKLMFCGQFVFVAAHA